ncbi:nucleoside triphosphate pyrophosphohydrolase [Bacillus mycoides]|uniref:nucleoside triphosphate pyrophosphohydrolase n=1 Tax=Bacillus mycoides TaxID=1405 RepID=UPI003F7CC198
MLITKGSMTPLPQDEYIKELCKKTEEELTEYLEATTKEHKLEELSDLLELINALAEHEGTTLEAINKIRKKKAEERGGFSNRVFLIKVTDNQPLSYPSQAPTK